MSRLLVRAAEIDGAVRMAVNAGMDPARAAAAAEHLYAPAIFRSAVSMQGVDTTERNPQRRVAGA